MPKQQERGFKYQKRTKEDLKERANMRGGNFDSYIKPKFQQWKPKDGKNLIRILPPTWDDARHYGYDIYINFNIGADNNAYLSLKLHGKGADPLDEARREAQKDGDKDLAKALNYSHRILYWIIDRSDEEAGPLLWAAPFTFDKSLSNLCIDEDTKEVIFIDDPAKGRDVRFYKEGQGLMTKYDPSKMKVLGESSLHEDEGIEADWLDFISDNSLPEVLNFYDYEHIKAMFDGQAGRRDDNEDSEKEVLSRKADSVQPRATRAAKVSDDARDDDRPARRAARVEEAGEDDEAPPRKQSSRARVEDDDEEVPARARRKPVSSEDDEVPKKAAPRTRARVVEEEDEDEAPPSTRRSNGSDDDGGGSLRERLAARRRSRDDD